MSDEKRDSGNLTVGGAAQGVVPEVSQEEIDAFIKGHRGIGPVGPEGRKVLRRRTVVVWHGVVNWYHTHSIWERLVYAAVYLSLPVTAAVNVGWSRTTVIALIALAVFQGRKAWIEYSPKNMQLVRRNYVERKLRFKTLIEDSFRRDQMSDHEVQRFREEALKLIATYVRDHRHDRRGKRIYVNLLVQDGDEIVVLARNEQIRKPGARYPKAHMLAGRVLDTGEPQVTGDVFVDFPECSAGKTYRSILALPVFHDSKVAGVVSIDSHARHHFDAEADALFDYLSPYVAVVSWTLSKKYVTPPPVGER